MARLSNYSRVFFLVFLASVLAGQGAYAIDDAEKGREVFNKYKDAVITIKLVISNEMVMGGQSGMKHEIKTEVTGTVISKDGLALISLTPTDPSASFAKIMGGITGMSSSEMDFRSNVTDVKMLVGKGQEIEAEIVLRDTDLDFAFVRPKKKIAREFAFVDLRKYKSAAVLDEVLTIKRLGKVAHRECAVSLKRISAIVNRPRKFYILDQSLTEVTLGSPVFLITGEPLGITMLRFAPGAGQAALGSMFLDQTNLGVLPIVVPGKDILEAASQVPPWKQL